MKYRLPKVNCKFFYNRFEISRKHKFSSTPVSDNPFHLAIPVHCMKEARHFYGNILGLQEGRRSENKWQDYSLFGHQIVCHFVGPDYRCPDFYNPVDGDEVPVPHFGPYYSIYSQIVM